MFGKKKKEFVFEEEGQDFEDRPMVGNAKPAKAPVKKGSSTRTLLLLLLLVVAGGGAYFVTMNEPEPPPPPAPVAQRQAIPIAKPQPVPAAEPAAAEPATAAAAADEPSKVAEPTAAPAENAPAPVAVVAAPAPAAEAPVTAAAPAAAAAEKPSAKAAVLEPTPTVLPTAAPVQKKPAVSTGKYTLVTGAYADKGIISNAQRSVRNLGYQPQVTTIKQDTTMTRLRYGTFRPEEAPARLNELKRVAPGAFSLPKGELVSVYAGSFAVQEKARAFADALSQQQVLVQEEMVKVKVPLQQITFGSFAERGAADKAAAKARAAGLDVTVQARR